MAGARDVWDAAADTFDDEPDHGLTDATVRAAWRDLLRRVLPTAPARVLDVGAGTGSVAVLLAGAGYDVLGLDISPRMVARAEVKAAAAGVPARFLLGDAARPAVDGRFDVVLCRHVLWALSDPRAALVRWVDLVEPGGLVILVEGVWSTGAGLPSALLLEWVRAAGCDATREPLSDRDTLWGRRISDDRYLVVGHKRSNADRPD